MSCPAGKELLGGGSVTSGNVTNVAIYRDGVNPLGSGTWVAAAQEFAAEAGAWSLATEIYCADMQP